MKNFYTFYVCLLALTISQEGISQLSYGVKGGLNLSSIGGKSVEDVSTRAGFHVGLVGNLELTEKLSLQPEIQYSQRGFKREIYSGDSSNFDPIPRPVTVEAVSRFDYVDIPIVAQYKIVDRLTIEAGPQLGFFLSEKTEIDGVDVEEDGTGNDAFALVEVGLVGGLGYYMENGLFFQGRYILGVTDIFDNDVITLNDDAVLNRNIQFSIGYFF